MIREPFIWLGVCLEQGDKSPWTSTDQDLSSTSQTEASSIAHPPDKKRRVEKRQRKRRQSLDGDGAWRLKTGERRQKDRRSEDHDDSPIIHLPFLDDEWAEAEKNDDQGNGPDIEQNGVNSNQSNQPASENPNIASTTSTNAAGQTDGDQSAMNRNKQNRKLSADQQARLDSLKSMLDASNARYQQASKNRRPVFAAGIEVRVVDGDHAGVIGVVLDADYIENRALVSIQGQDAPVWIQFRALGNPG